MNKSKRDFIVDGYSAGDKLDMSTDATHEFIQSIFEHIANSSLDEIYISHEGIELHNISLRVDDIYLEEIKKRSEYNKRTGQTDYRPLRKTNEGKRGASFKNRDIRVVQSYVDGKKHSYRTLFSFNMSVREKADAENEWYLNVRYSPTKTISGSNYRPVILMKSKAKPMTLEEEINYFQLYPFKILNGLSEKLDKTSIIDLNLDNIYLHSVQIAVYSQELSNTIDRNKILNDLYSRYCTNSNVKTLKNVSGSKLLGLKSIVTTSQEVYMDIGLGDKVKAPGGFAVQNMTGSKPVCMVGFYAKDLVMKSERDEWIDKKIKPHIRRLRTKYKKDSNRADKAINQKRAVLEKEYNARENKISQEDWDMLKTRVRFDVTLYAEYFTQYIKESVGGESFTLNEDGFDTIRASYYSKWIAAYAEDLDSIIRDILINYLYIDFIYGYRSSTNTKKMEPIKFKELIKFMRNNEPDFWKAYSNKYYLGSLIDNDDPRKLSKKSLCDLVQNHNYSKSNTTEFWNSFRGVLLEKFNYDIDLPYTSRAIAVKNSMTDKMDYISLMEQADYTDDDDVSDNREFNDMLIDEAKQARKESQKMAKEFMGDGFKLTMLPPEKVRT